jgi:hypothetical protein
MFRMFTLSEPEPFAEKGFLMGAAEYYIGGALVRIA